MELFAAGFNAWNQLSFQEPTSDQDPDEEPHDLHLFSRVLQGTYIERPVANLSSTIVRHDGRFRIAGLVPVKDAQNSDLEFLSIAAETANGEILTSTNPPSGESCSSSLHKYSSLSSWKLGDAVQSWPCSAPVKHIAAFDTGFVILYQDGTVSTLGDPRFESTLGRDTSPEQHAQDPGPVTDLNDLDDPVKHITAGSLSVAALTDSGSVYVWGTSSTGTHRARQPLPSVSGVPNYVAVDGDKDVADVALGDSHAIALTTDGCVYVIGEDTNGQLGLGRTSATRIVEEWTRVPFKTTPKFEVVGVAAGPRASFIITSRVMESWLAT